MPTKVLLPGYFTEFNALYTFTGAIVGMDGLPKDDGFTFDFQGLKFIDGTGLTVFCNTLEWLWSHGAKTYCLNQGSMPRGAIKYLDDCGFFERYLKRRLSQDAAIRWSTIPFRKVSHDAGFGWIGGTLTPWLAAILETKEAALESVQMCMREVFNNIQDHSTQSVGFVHAQLYPSINTVRITVSDFGKGIPATVRAKAPGPMDDGQAIRKAIQLGFTAKSKSTNEGLGLDTLTKYVTSRFGTVTIASLGGMLRCFRSPTGGVIARPSTGNGIYPGTLVEMSFQTHLFTGDDTTEGAVEW